MPGFNIDAPFVIDRGKLINWTRDFQPDAHTVIDDYKQGYSLCRDLHDASPNTLLVHRHYFQGGENTLRYLDVVDWNVPEFVIIGIGNEPGLEGQDLDNTLLMNVEALEIGAFRNKSVCVGNYSTGSYRQEDIDAGKYDDLLRTLDKYHDLHYLGLHEYRLARKTYIFLHGRKLTDIIDTSKAGPEYDVTPEQFVKDYLSQFHIGRYYRLVKRCEHLGIRAPRIILTEYGWDRNGDEIAQVPQIDAFAERTVTGINTLATYNRKMWPWRSWEESAAYQTAHLETCYTEHVVGKCLYAWTVQGEWEHYDFGRHDNLLKLLPKGKRVPPIPQIEEWIDVDIYPLDTSGMRFRAGPSQSDATLRIIQTREDAQILKNADRTVSESNWIKVRSGDAIGFIRSDVIGIDDFLDTPETPVDIQQALELLGRLQVLHDTIDLHQSEIEEKLDKLRALLESGQS